MKKTCTCFKYGDEFLHYLGGIAQERNSNFCYFQPKNLGERTISTEIIKAMRLKGMFQGTLNSTFKICYPWKFKEWVGITRNCFSTEIGRAKI